jgi:DNA-directed RNA polymerase subunit RPC12/RpoP
MCDFTTYGANSHRYGEKQYKLSDFFNEWWDTYVQSPTKPIRPEQYKAVNFMRVCRTERLGVDHYVCSDCGEITNIYHSCKHRFCPTCSWKDTIKWAEKVKDNMLNLPHRHVVFTLPHQLNGLIKSNDKHLLNFLFQVAADTFQDWMNHKYNLKPGVISVLHTFGETKQFHPHVHMIVSWGGINKETNQLEAIKGEYVKYKFLKDKYRCKFEDKLVKMYDRDELKHQFRDRKEFMRFLRKINMKSWCIHMEPPMSIPTQVIRYIGRYSKRACLSEYKITNIEGEEISFKYKDYKNKDVNGKPIEKELTLNYRDFFPRLLQHVPLPHFRIVRYYGLYATKNKIDEKHLYKGSEKEQQDLGNAQEDQLENTTGIDPLYCERCQKEKQYLYTSFEKKDKTNIIVKRTEFNWEKERFKDLVA